MAIDQNRSFEIGLDIGCGTGKSSLPLKKYCRQIFGIDPSQSMIDKAEKDSSISYICGDEMLLNKFENHNFDLVTFAGSLTYSKSNTLRTELKRVCRANASIIIYDFEVLLGEFLKTIGLNLIPIESSDYDHSIDLTDWNEFDKEIGKKDQMTLNISEENLSHLILSHSTWHTELAEIFEVQNPFDQLRVYLKSKGVEFQIPVNIFYSRFKVGT